MKKYNVAIIGAGPDCLAIMDMISRVQLRQLQMHIVGIADINPQAPGLGQAHALNIFTTSNYKDLFSIPDLDLIIELTGDPDFSQAIQHEKPVHVHLMDHTVAKLFWDFRGLGDEKLHAEKEVEEQSNELKASEEEVRRQKRTAEGIIYGSPTPMFVIDTPKSMSRGQKRNQAGSACFRPLPMRKSTTNTQFRLKWWAEIELIANWPALPSREDARNGLDLQHL